MVIEIRNKLYMIEDSILLQFHSTTKHGLGGFFRFQLNHSGNILNKIWKKCILSGYEIISFTTDEFDWFYGIHYTYL